MAYREKAKVAPGTVKRKVPEGAPALKVKRMSKSIWDAPGHDVQYNYKTHYLECVCAEFQYRGTCPAAEFAMAELHAEGRVVHRSKSKKPVFLEEQGRFRKRFGELCGKAKYPANL